MAGQEKQPRITRQKVEWTMIYREFKEVQLTISVDQYQMFLREQRRISLERLRKAESIVRSRMKKKK